MEQNNKKMEEAQKKLAEEQLKLVEEQRKMLEQKQRMEDEDRKRKKSEQEVILNKKNARPKLSFSLGGKQCIGDICFGLRVMKSCQPLLPLELPVSVDVR